MSARSTGLTKDAGWQVGVSRTLPQSPATVWEFISGPRGLELWLGAGARLTDEPGTPYETEEGIAGEVRGYRPGDRIRVTYGDTTVQVAVSAAGGGRSVLVFHQERMAGPEERERQRAHWRRVMERVAEALDERA